MTARRPFEAVFLPATNALVRQLRSDFGALLTPGSWGILRTNALRDLAEMSWRPLLREFAAYRSPHVSSLELLSGAIRGSELYRAFIAEVETGRLGLSSEVQARVALGQSQLLEELHLALTRLEADREMLAAWLGGDAPLRVRLHRLRLSDRHARGRVISFAFDGLGLLYYKPRSLAPELLVSRLLTDAAFAGLASGLVPPVLTSDDYGWMRAVDLGSAQSDGDRYYRRLGAVTALLHAIRGVDFHQENVIASSNVPILIDCETILTPRTTVQHEAGPLDESCLSTGLVPRWVSKPDGGAEDVSGAAPRGRHRTVVTFEQIGTDALVVRDRASWRAAGTNLPPGVRLSRRHIGAMTAGFVDGYRYAQKARSPLQSMVSDAGDVSTRVLLRSTSEYQAHIQRLMDGSRPIVDCAVPLAPLRGEMGQAVTAVEGMAVRRLLVPVFSTTSESSSVTMDGQYTWSIVAEAGGVSACSRIERLSETDLARQVELLELATSAHLVGTRTSRALDPSPVAVRKRPHDVSAVLRAAAVALGDRVAMSLQPGMGSLDLAWTLVDHPRHFALDRRPLGLYEGSLGTAIGLAGVQAMGSHDYSNEILRITSPLLEAIDARGQPDQAFTSGTEWVGLGSLLYGLVLLAQLTGLDAYRSAAESLAGPLNEGPLPTDTGSLLGLCALAEVAKGPLAATLVTTVTRHILDSLDNTERRVDRYLSLALSRVPRALGGADASVAARRLAVQGADREAPSPNPRRREPWTWCHGAPGRWGLLASTHLLDPNALGLASSQVAAALMAPCEVDDLCCGAMGRIEAALLVADVLGDSALRTRARDRALTVATRHACLRLRTPSGFPHLGWMQGLSGIAYHLARTADPDGLPSVLTWSLRGPRSGQHRSAD